MRRLAWWLGSATALALASHACLDVADLNASPADAGSDAGTDVVVDAKPEASSPSLPVLDTHPPPRPSGAAVPSGSGAMRWFAARRIYAGTVDFTTGEKNTAAWRKIGHDIDGECTTLQQSQDNSSLTCAKAASGAADSLADGEDCRDNAYGKILSSGTQSLASNWEKQFESDLANGKPTLLLRLSDLDDGSDDPYVPGAVYLTVPRDTPPKWNGTDVFQVQKATVQGDAITDPPAIAFPNGYLTGNTWVSGERDSKPSQFPILLISDILLTTTSGTVVVTALDPSHVRAVGSVMSTVIAQSAVVDEWFPFLADVVGCSQVLVDILTNQFIMPAMDLASAPPSYQSQGSTCDSLSVGTVYEWVPVQAPKDVVDVPPPFTPCDGG